MDFGLVILALFGLAVLGFLFEGWRKRDLLKRYGDTAEGNAIANKQVFVGMSQWQLIDAWGYPKSKSSRVLKTKTKETWVYDAANHIYLEDGYVVGWKQKT